jgi:hypothetical protein
MPYTERFRTPSPRYPTPSPTTLERLIATWERLRQLDIEGYRTSQATPMSTWLVQIDWADGRRSMRSPGRGTTCSPFTTQSTAMAYSQEEDSPYTPRLATGEQLPLLFCRAANSNMTAAHQREMDRYGLTLRDNGWPRPVIFFNMGYAVEPTQMRRGDAVHIDWASGGGHAVFCWDVHLDARGEVDAFQFVSSNGRIRVGDSNAGAGAGVSVGGTPLGEGGFIRQVSSSPLRYEALRQPLFTDDERYVADGTWVTWHRDLKLSDLGGCRVRPRGRLALASVVKAARFHGVTPPDSFAMGGAVKAPPREEESADVLLQRRLKMLYEIGWISADPGAPDGVLGPRTRAAVRAFQAEYQLKEDGIPGPRTRGRLREVYEMAAHSPEGKHYLATGQGVRGGGGRDLGALDEPPGVVAFYFRHGAVRAGEEIELVLVARGLPGRSFALRVWDQATGQAVADGVPIEIGEDGRGACRVRAGAAGARLCAAIDLLGIETQAPAWVV